MHSSSMRSVFSSIHVLLHFCISSCWLNPRWFWLRTASLKLLRDYISVSNGDWTKWLFKPETCFPSLHFHCGPGAPLHKHSGYFQRAPIFSTRSPFKHISHFSSFSWHNASCPHVWLFTGLTPRFSRGGSEIRRVIRQSGVEQVWGASSPATASSSLLISHTHLDVRKNTWRKHTPDPVITVRSTLAKYLVGVLRKWKAVT